MSAHSADLAPFPTDRLTGEQIARLSSELTRLQDQGVDLGPRGHHIRMVGETLETTAAQLAAVVEALRHSPGIDVVSTEAEREALGRLVTVIRRLAGMARGFPRSEAGDA